MTGKHVVRSRGQNQQRSHETQLDFSPAPATSSTFSMKENASSSGVLTWQSSSQATGDTNRHALRNTPDIPGSLREPALHFVYNMMGELFVDNPRQDVIHSAPWFSSLLDHLGRSPALDAAMCAFMLRLVGTSKNDEGEISRSRALYGQTLRSLQRALDHPVAWKSTETLAATMICCQIELFAGTLSPLSWMVHAVGVSKLIQHRGYRCFSTRVEKALLRGFRPLIIMNCIFSGKDCFLDQPKWQKLSASLSFDTAGDVRRNEVTYEPLGPLESLESLESYWSRYHNNYYVLLSKVPPVTRVAYDIREDRKHGIAPDPSQVKLLAQQAGRLRSECLAWYDGVVSSGAITPPVEVLSEDPNSPFITIVKFSSPWIGSVYMGYWATMLILQEALNECQAGQDRPYDEGNQELARKILRSLEHVGRGIMGPYRVGYALRVAYEFADLPLRVWVESILEKHTQQYAALSPETYPRLHGKSGPQLFRDAAGIRNGL